MLEVDSTISGIDFLLAANMVNLHLKIYLWGIHNAITVNYAGRHLKGSSAILVCQADGQWTGQPPVCESQCDTVCLNGRGFCNSNNRKCTCQPGYSGDRCQHGI